MRVDLYLDMGCCSANRYALLHSPASQWVHDWYRAAQESDVGQRQRAREWVYSLNRQSEALLRGLSGLASEEGWPESTAGQAAGFWQEMHHIVREALEAVDQYLGVAPSPASSASPSASVSRWLPCPQSLLASPSFLIQHGNSAVPTALPASLLIDEEQHPCCALETQQALTVEPEEHAGNSLQRWHALHRPPEPQLVGYRNRLHQVHQRMTSSLRNQREVVEMLVRPAQSLCKAFSTLFHHQLSQAPPLALSW